MTNKIRTQVNIASAEHLNLISHATALITSAQNLASQAERNRDQILQTVVGAQIGGLDVGDELRLSEDGKSILVYDSKG
jgi:hypothetical protein